MEDQEISMHLLLKLMEKTAGGFSVDEQKPGFVSPQTVGKAYQAILKAVKEAK